VTPLVPLDAVSDRLFKGMARGDDALLWIQARWDRIVGEPLSRKVSPVALTGRRLTLKLLDPAWKKPIEATLPELERKLAYEVPEVKPRVFLR
jgi:Dna[CI] antecedent DciA-like protein